MDLLKAEIARKRAGVGAHLNGAKRFVKRSELLAAEEEERRRKQAEAHGRRASPSGAAAVDGDAPHEKVLWWCVG